jgi:hypothetical protein
MKRLICYKIAVLLQSSRWLRTAVAILFSSFICIGSCNATTDITPEYKLKAALLYKLNRFIEWPPTSLENSNNTFSFCILGTNRFGDILESLRKRSIKDLPVEINYYAQSDEVLLGSCQILFISDSKRAFITDILKKLKSSPTLTISDMHNFANSGGMIEFTQGEEKIGFIINLESARLSGISIAAPLLQMSDVIGEKK